MSFHISQELLLERAIVVWATILLFGLVSIGALTLWRRYIATSNTNNRTVDELNRQKELLNRTQEIAERVYAGKIPPYDLRIGDEPLLTSSRDLPVGTVKEIENFRRQMDALMERLSGEILLERSRR